MAYYHHQQPRLQDIQIPMDPTVNYFALERHHSSDVVLLETEKSEPGSSQLTRTLSTASDSVFQGMELQKNSRVLTLGLVLPIYYMLTCGGPAGIEPVVASGGPLIGVISLIAFPLVFSAPFALLVSEMCTAFPDDGGFVVWVTHAFGPFWGFQEGYWSWIATVLNNALYPGFIIDALTPYIGKIQSPIVEFGVKAAIVVVISLPTLFGAKKVAITSLLLVVLVVMPFMIATGWFFAKADHYEVLLETPGDASQSTWSFGGSVQWKALITRLFWSYDNIFLVSVFGGQIVNPAYTYPRAILITLGLSVVTYVVPLVGAIAVDTLNWQAFQEDSLTLIASRVGGSMLRGLLTIAAVCSNAGMFTAETFAQCYQVNGMAEQGLMPKGLTRRHEFFETPCLALLLNTLPVLFLLTIDFKKLLDATNCLSAATQVLLIAAAIRLRLTRCEMYQFKTCKWFTCIAFVDSWRFPVSNRRCCRGGGDDGLQIR